MQLEANCTAQNVIRCWVDKNATHASGRASMHSIYAHCRINSSSAIIAHHASENALVEHQSLTNKFCLLHSLRQYGPTSGSSGGCGHRCSTCGCIDEVRTILPISPVPSTDRR